MAGIGRLTPTNARSEGKAMCSLIKFNEYFRNATKTPPKLAVGPGSLPVNLPRKRRGSCFLG